MSINSDNYEFDSFITQQICQYFDSDCRVPDFFSLIKNQHIEINTHSKIPYCKDTNAYCSISNDLVKRHPYLPKEQIILDYFDYPDKVLEYIAESARVLLGYFTLSDFFYCIVDNHIVLFDKDKKISIIPGGENLDSIISCDVALPDKLIYETKEVIYLLIYSTVNSINIVPIGKTCDKTYLSEAVSIQTSFLPLVIKAYPTHSASDIFIGGNDGDVYCLSYKFSQYKAAIEIKIQNLTSGFFMSLVHKFLRFTQPIRLLCYESTTCFLAAVDTSSNIRFYKYDAEQQKLNEVSKYATPSESSVKVKIVSINEIPISDSEFTRFVCITNTGSRLFFGTIPGITLNEEIHPLSKLYPPSVLSTDHLESGCFYLNYSIIVYKNSISILHPYYHLHQPENNPTEFFDGYDFEDITLINIFTKRHKYQTQPNHLFYHEILWEHISCIPVFYLISTSGIYKLTVCRPVDVLRDLIMESKGYFSSPIREWMSFYGEEAESASTLLLMASESDRTKSCFRWSLNILYQYSFTRMNQASSSISNSINSLSPACAGFIQRATKLLSVIWQTPVITKDRNGKYCLSPIFCEMPKVLKDKLKNLIDLCDEYMKVRSSLSPLAKNSYQQKGEAYETRNFVYLKKFLENIIEVLSFISTISTQSIDIDSAFKSLKSKSQKRLSIDSFGTEIQNISLFDALREFSDSLSRKNPHIIQLFGEE